MAFAEADLQELNQAIEDAIIDTRISDDTIMVFVHDDVYIEDSSLKEQLPTPTGYRLLVLPFSRKQKTKGGLYLANETLEKERIATNVGYVVSLGPDAYADKDRYPAGAWCQEGDWVIFGRYAGARIKIEGGDLRLLNDDDVLAVITDPEDVVSG